MEADWNAARQRCGEVNDGCIVQIDGVCRHRPLWSLHMLAPAALPTLEEKLLTHTRTHTHCSGATCQPEATCAGAGRTLAHEQVLWNFGHCVCSETLCLIVKIFFFPSTIGRFPSVRKCVTALQKTSSFWDHSSLCLCYPFAFPFCTHGKHASPKQQHNGFLHPQKALSHLPPRLYFGDTEVKGLSWPLTLKAVKGGFRVRQVLKTATGWSCFYQWKTGREITKWYMWLQKYLKWILILSNQNTVIKSRTNKNNFQILLTL